MMNELFLYTTLADKIPAATVIKTSEKIIRLILLIPFITVRGGIIYYKVLIQIRRFVK